jgi:hypothetical protein
MPAVNPKGYVPPDYSFKNGAYIVTPYTTEIKVGKSGKRGLYLIFIIVASVDPSGANAVGRTVLKWIDIESDRGANELAFVAKTFGLDTEGDSSDEEFVQGLFNSTDPNANYYIRAMLSEVERPGNDGRVFQSLEIDTSRKTREPMLSPLSNAEITLIPEDDKVNEIFAKAQAAAVAKENRRKSGSYGGGQQASKPAKPKDYDDGFGSSGATVPYNDEDVPF